MSDTIADRIHSALMQRIVTGDLPGGEKLRQDHIAREYDTSHVPVREALLRLEARGLAVSVPHKGTRVSDLDPLEIREVVEMRIALETLALSRSIAQMTEQDLQRIETARQACDQAASLETWVQADRQFHMALLRPCAMPRLLATLEDLQISASRHFFAQLPPDQRQQWQPRPDADHADLVQALRNGEARQAEVVLRSHLRRTR